MWPSVHCRAFRVSDIRTPCTYSDLQVLRAATRDPELQPVLIAALALVADWPQRAVACSAQLPDSDADPTSILLAAIHHVGYGRAVNQAEVCAAPGHPHPSMHGDAAAHTAESAARFASFIVGMVASGDGISGSLIDVRPTTPSAIIECCCLPYLCSSPASGDRHSLQFPLAILEAFAGQSAGAVATAVADGAQETTATARPTGLESPSSTRRRRADHEWIVESRHFALVHGLCELVATTTTPSTTDLCTPDTATADGNPTANVGLVEMRIRHRAATLLQTVATALAACAIEIPPPFLRLLTLRFSWEVLLPLEHLFRRGRQDGTAQVLDARHRFPLPGDLVRLCGLELDEWDTGLDHGTHETSVTGALRVGVSSSPTPIPPKPSSDDFGGDGQNSEDCDTEVSGLVRLLQACRSSAPALRTELLLAFGATRRRPRFTSVLRAALLVLPSSDAEQTCAIITRSLKAILDPCDAVPQLEPSVSLVNNMPSCFAMPWEESRAPPTVDLVSWVLVRLLRQSDVSTALRVVPYLTGVIQEAAVGASHTARTALWSHACCAARTATEMAPGNECGHQLLVVCFDLVKGCLDSKLIATIMPSQERLAHFVRLARGSAVLPGCPERVAMRKLIEEAAVQSL